VGFLTSFFMAATLPMALLYGLHLQVGTVHGDLTRLARLSSHDFGRRASPDAPALQLRQADLERPKVVVLGDSFSRWNQWQSHWMGLRGHNDVISFHWDRIGSSACLSTWAQAMPARYPEARQLIVEVIERSFGSFVLSLDKPCEMLPRSTQPNDTRDETLPDRRDESFWPPPDPKYVVMAWAAEHRSFDNQSRLAQQVLVTPLNRADLFTSRRSDRLLTLHDDQAKAHWRADMFGDGLSRLAALGDSLARKDITLIMVVVPDKSTAYAPYLLHADDHAKAGIDAWQLLRAAGIRQVPLREAVRNALPATRDLYLPDDTHFSLEGYRQMAIAVHDEARR
jgi:hypothetical protein